MLEKLDFGNCFNIAISGKANSGKNTVFKILVEELGLVDSVVKDIAFADPIKDGLLKLYPRARRDYLFGPSKLRAEIIPGTTVTYRQVLCDLGAQARKYDEDHWVKILIDEVHGLQSCSEKFPQPLQTKAMVVTDLRFPNEFTALREQGFYVIRVKREEQLNLTDISETSQDALTDEVFNAVLKNNGTLDELRLKCKAIATHLKEIKCRSLG